MVPVPAIRIEVIRDTAPRADRDYVLYWMIASRRPRFNFGLQHAVELARELQKPLVVLEALRCDYRWASDRLHRFVLQGMAANARHFSRKPVLYHPYVEPRRGAGKGLLAKLAERACVVVTDLFPCFFLPRMVAAAARQIDARLEQVDSNGLLPLAAADTVFTTAYAFRRHLQKALPDHLHAMPLADPLLGSRLPRLDALPASLTRRWPAASAALLAAGEPVLADLPIDHRVPPVPIAGGAAAAAQVLAGFLGQRLRRYAEARNEPDADVGSGLSPYLHFGHVSAHEIFVALAKHERWSLRKLGARAHGKREGWWGMSPGAEAFLDELVTWRELGYNLCARRADHDQYDSLPDWALASLAKHTLDPREHLYDLPAFAAARTHDPLWNAAQRQLLGEGRIHNYLRMLWGKKILEWSETPEEALATMIELNNRYAVDGRNPNSYTGIFWVLGRYDRPWPERPVFGVIRAMTSESTRRKLDVEGYLRRWCGGEPSATARSSRSRERR